MDASAGTPLHRAIDLGDGIWMSPGLSNTYLFATDDGRVHVFRSDLTEPPGFPVRTDRAP